MAIQVEHLHTIVPAVQPAWLEVKRPEGEAMLPVLAYAVTRAGGAYLVQGDGPRWILGQSTEEQKLTLRIRPTPPELDSAVQLPLEHLSGVITPAH